MAEEKRKALTPKEVIEGMYKSVVQQLQRETNIITRYELNIVQQTLQQVYNEIEKQKDLESKQSN